jgi:hypothetical protein
VAVTKTTAITELGGILIIDFDADDTVENNVTGNSSGSIYLVEIDNTANTTDVAYLRIKDAISAPTQASLTPTWMFTAPAGAKASYAMPEGQAYTVGVTMWCTSSNAAQNQTAPTNAVIVRLIAS